MEKKNELIRVALIGPESTGKSMLSEQLAKYFGAHWIPEYSREYLSGLEHSYTLEDILQIAKEQQRREDELLSSSPGLLFADTELIISRVWCEDVFHQCPQWIMEQIPQKKYDLYLLTSPDLPWQEDPLRENPHRREYFFEWYRRELESIGADYIVISGLGETRYNQAIQAVKNFLDARNN